jgi:hypothetical protein
MRWFLFALFSCGVTSVGWCEEMYLGKTIAQWEQQLTTGSTQEKYVAAWSIAQIGTPAATITEQHAHHTDSAIRVWLVIGQANLVQQASSPELREKYTKQLELALEDSAPAVSIVAAEALLRLEKPIGLAALKKWLQHDSAHVRYRALAALDRPWFFDDAELLKIIAELNKNPSEYEGRIADRILEQAKK